MGIKKNRIIAVKRKNLLVDVHYILGEQQRSMSKMMTFILRSKLQWKV